MHILFIPSWYFDKEAEGVFIHEHARMTVQQGHQVGLIYVRHGGLFERTEVAWSITDKIRTGILKKYSLPKVQLAIGLWKRHYLWLFKAYCEKHGTPDILHAHGYLAGIATRYISGITSIPYVITEHSTAIPEETIPSHHRRELGLVYDQATALIAVSAFLRKAMIKWLSVPKEITIIGNPVDFSRYELRSTEKRRDKVRLISIGSLEPRKNHELLFRTLHELRKYYDAELVVIGTGPEKDKLVRLASALHILDGIHLIAYISLAELIEHLRNADFFVASSTMENFGVAIVEALACGIPVITTPCGGPEEYLHQGTGRLALSHEPMALYTAVEDAMNHSNDFNASEIRSYVRQKFDFPVIGSQVDAVYMAISK